MNYIKRIVILCVLVFSHTVLSAPQIPLESFAKLPDVEKVSMSPSGNKLAFLKRVTQQGKRVIAIEVLDLTTGKKSYPIVNADNAYDVNSIIWASDRHMLIKAGFYNQRNKQDSSGHHTIHSGIKLRERRLLVIDLEKNTLKNIITKSMMKRYQKKEWMPQNQDTIVDMLPNDPEHILHSVDWNAFSAPQVFKVNLTTLKRELVQMQEKYWTRWMTDKQSRVRVGFFRKKITGSLEKNRMEYRINIKNLESGQWSEFWRFSLGDSNAEVWPLGFMNDPNILLVKAKHEGFDAIFKVNVKKETPELELFYSTANTHIGGKLFYSPVTKEAVGYFSNGGVIFWDEKYKRLDDGVKKALPTTYTFLMQMSDNEKKYIVYSKSDVDSGTYYLGDRDKKSLDPIAFKYQDLDPAYMVKAKRHLLKMRDGKKSKAFLYSPSNSNLSDSPLVIYPMMSVGSADVGAFNYYVQFLVNRGYAVLQTNLRNSSSGFSDMMEGGLSKWGDHVYQDIEDSLDWAISKGITTAGKTCLMGNWDGGFAVMLAAAKSPSKYKCVVSTNSISDIQGYLHDMKNFKKYEVFMDMYSRDVSIQKAYSPITYAKNYQANVLLFHSENMVSTRSSQSKNMVDALKSKTRTAEYVELEATDGDISDDTQRIKMLSKIESFLHKNLIK